MIVIRTICEESADIHKPSGLYNLEGNHREDNTVQENHAKWPFPRDFKRLSKAFHFLREHFKEKLCLKQVAEIACMSPSYFCKFFKKTTNHTLTDYIYRLRIDKAKELLMKEDLQITQIGYEVGFESHSYFDKIFKRYTSLSPTEFSQQSDKAR